MHFKIFFYLLLFITLPKKIYKSCEKIENIFFLNIFHETNNFLLIVFLRKKVNLGKDEMLQEAIDFQNKLEDEMEKLNNSESMRECLRKHKNLLDDTVADQYQDVSNFFRVQIFFQIKKLNYMIILIP